MRLLRLRERTLFALGYTGSRHQSQDSHSIHTLKIFTTPSGSARGTESVGEFPLVGQEARALGEEGHKNLRESATPFSLVGSNVYLSELMGLNEQMGIPRLREA